MADKKKAKKKANGEGSIWKRSNGTWVAQVSFIDPVDGKRKRKSVTGKTKQETLKKKRKLETAKDAGRLVDNGKLTLEQWINKWLEVYKKPTLKYSTWYSYRSLADLHIIPALGDRQLDWLQPNEIQAFYNRLSESGRIVTEKNKKQVEGKPPGLSPRTVRLCHIVINGALKQAAKENLILWNPVTATEPPRQIKNEISPLSAKQVVYFLKAIEEDELLPVIFTDLGTGLRRGELLGLKWDDIDLEEGTAIIRRSLLQVGGKVYLQNEVKTKASKAAIKLPSEVVIVLKQVKRQQAKNKLRLGKVSILKLIHPIFSN